MHSLRSPDPTPADIERGYEGTAITVRVFVYFVIGFIVVAAAIHTGIWFLLVAFEHQAKLAHDERFPPALLSLNRIPFPPPNLQPSPDHQKVDWQDMDDLRNEQEASLIAAGFERITVADRATPGGLPIAGKVLTPLRVSPQVVEKVGRFISESRTAPTTMPDSSGASGALTPLPAPGAPPGSAPQEGITQPRGSDSGPATTPSSPAAGESAPAQPAGKTGDVTEPPKVSPAPGIESKATPPTEQTGGTQ